MWRRDFENGIVLVNPTPEAMFVSLAQIQGPLRRTNIRRIKGNQVPAWNSGAAVTSQGSPLDELGPGDFRSHDNPTNVLVAPAPGGATLTWQGAPQ